MSRQHIVRQLCELGMVEMKPTGSWGLTRGGEDFLDQLALMRELDTRPGATRASQARRQPPLAQRSGQATPPTGERQGDDGPAPRGMTRGRS